MRAFLTGVLQGLGFAFGACLVAVTLYAQGGVVPGGGRGISGVTYLNNMWGFRTPTGARAPTVLGIVTPPLIEPTTPAESGSIWIFCSGPADATQCKVKVNIAGNILEITDVTYSLPGGTQ